MHRFVVTGMGIVCALGNNLEEVWRNAKQGVCGIKEVTKLDVSGCTAKYAAEIKNFKPRNPQLRAGMDEVAIMGLETVWQALQDAKIDLKQLDKSRIGVVVGSCTGGIQSFERLQRDWMANPAKAHPKDVLKSAVHVISGNIAHHLGVTGPTANISNACAAGTISIAYACNLIETRAADLVIAGGADTLGGLPFSGFYALKSLDEQPCSPFSRSSGITLGEGAATLIIESYAHARQRGAAIYCEITGFGVTNEAYHITAPRPDGSGQVMAIAKALEQAGLGPEAIDYLNAHGTGTALNDGAEQAALQSVFAPVAANLSISSSKAMTGHCLGAAGAIEAVFAIKCLQENYVLPTLNFDVGAAPPFDFVPNRGKAKKVHYAMSNSLAFGGDHASIIFGDAGAGAGASKQASGRVVITGMGIVSPIGVGVQEYWDNLNKGKNGITQVNPSNGTMAGTYAGIVNIADFSIYGISPGALRKMDRLTKLLLTAGKLAMEDGSLVIDDTNRDLVGVIVGTSEGPVTEMVHFQAETIEKGIHGGRAFVFPNTVFNAAGGVLAQQQGLQGYTTTFSNGALSGITSVCCGYDLLRSQSCQTVIAAGVDEYSEPIRIGYQLLRALDQELPPVCQPYAFRRNGFVLGEGGVALSMEPAERAQARNARCYAEILGYGLGHSPVKAGKIDPRGCGLEQAIQLAFQNAGITSETVDAIVGFGNGSSLVDRMELEVYGRVFGERIRQLPIYTIKASIGEARAAASALQIAHAALLLSTGLAPVTRRGYPAEYRWRTRKIPLLETGQSPETVLVTGFAFGGAFNAVVLRKVVNQDLKEQ